MGEDLDLIPGAEEMVDQDLVELEPQLPMVNQDRVESLQHQMII